MIPLSEECKSAIRLLIDEIGNVYDIEPARCAILRVRFEEIVLDETHSVLQRFLAEARHLVLHTEN